MNRLTFRVEAPLARVLGMETAELEILSTSPEHLPNLRCTLPGPAKEKVSLVIRIHSRAGIPLAQASVEVNPGDKAFETTELAVFAMEGYSHLDRAHRLAIERRVWSRRAFATGSAA